VVLLIHKGVATALGRGHDGVSWDLRSTRDHVSTTGDQRAAERLPELRASAPPMF
jgi:hypothetical protein